MAVQLNAQRVRFGCDASKPFGNPNDEITGAAIQLPSGSALQIECLFYFGALDDAHLLDLTNFTQINIQLQDNSDPHSGTIFYAGSVQALNFATPSVADWQTKDPAKAHVTLFIPSAQNVVPPAVTSYWICIYGVTNNLAQDPVLLFACKINGKDSGIPANIGAIIGQLKIGSKVPFLCLDGQTRDLTLGQGPGGVWISQVNQAAYNGNGQAVYAVLCGDGLYRDLSLQLQDGNYVLAIDQNGHS